MIRMLIFALVLSGCANKAVIGDAIRQHVRALEAGNANMSTGRLAYAAAVAKGGELTRCAEIVEHALVYRTMAPWYAADALYLTAKLAGTDAGEKPGPAPLIPTAAAWCAERLAVVTSTPTGGTP